MILIIHLKLRIEAHLLQSLELLLTCEFRCTSSFTFALSLHFSLHFLFPDAGLIHHDITLNQNIAKLLSWPSSQELSLQCLFVKVLLA